MENIVILGAGQMGRAVRDLLNRNNLELVAIGDNDPRKWDYEAEVQVLPVAEALRAEPDRVIVGVLDTERAGQLAQQARQTGYAGPLMTLSELYTAFDVRGATLRRLSDRMKAAGIEGSIAELGVYRGDFAWQINDCFPDRTLYLFDTFDGFDERDVRTERRLGSSGARPHDFSDTGMADVLARMPYEDRAVLRKGYFPASAAGLEEERFALVSLDVDLYEPTMAGLAFFVPRLVPGGAILLHDFNNLQFDGVRRAVADYEEEHGRLTLVPLSDLHGTAAILGV